MEDSEQTGRFRRLSKIVHDEKGNPTFVWEVVSLDQQLPAPPDPEDERTAMALPLYTGDLAIEADETFQSDPHNPYMRQRCTRPARRTNGRTDLRALSAWIKIMRQMQAAAKSKSEAEKSNAGVVRVPAHQSRSNIAAKTALSSLASLPLVAWSEEPSWRSLKPTAHLVAFVSALCDYGERFDTYKRLAQDLSVRGGNGTFRADGPLEKLRQQVASAFDEAVASLQEVARILDEVIQEQPEAGSLPEIRSLQSAFTAGLAELTAIRQESPSPPHRAEHVTTPPEGPAFTSPRKHL
jgi:hypothetical protein